MRSMIRLWPEHHEDPALLAQTIGLLTKHRAACDEVWLCTPIGGLAPISEHRRQAALAAQAAVRFRAAGVRASLQVAATLAMEASSRLMLRKWRQVPWWLPTGNPRWAIAARVIRHSMPTLTR